MRTAQLAMVVGLVLLNSVHADDEKRTTDAKPVAKNVVSDEPMSIFDDEIRCFKFKIDHELVTVNYAIAFSHRYDNKDNPPIIGAFPDAETNSLCVIGAPEAEAAIRKTLATWIVELQGVAGSPLVLRRRELKAGREGLLSDLAELEMALVDTSGDEDKQIDIKARIEAFETELVMTERKIQVVDKYLKRIEEGGE